mgnify:CR=1 FL=1
MFLFSRAAKGDTPLESPLFPSSSLFPVGVFRGGTPKQGEEKGWGVRRREITPALNRGLSLPLNYLTALLQ